MKSVLLICFLLASFPSWAQQGGDPIEVTDNTTLGEELYKHVFVQLKRLRRVLREKKRFNRVTFNLLEDRIRNYDIGSAIQIINDDYRTLNIREVNKIVSRLRRKNDRFSR